MQSPPLARDVVVLGVLYLVGLVIVAASIGAVLDRGATAFVVDLFTDPVWLFGTVFGLALLVRAVRKHRERSIANGD